LLRTTVSILTKTARLAQFAGFKATSLQIIVAFGPVDASSAKVQSKKKQAK
jgi:hypothetical protein